MKLVHVITSLEIGGAQAVLFDLIIQLKKKGYEQTLIYLHDGPYKKRFAAEEILLIQLRGIVSSFDLVAWYRLIEILRKLKPDCIHTVLWGANWLGRLAARLLGIPCVVSLHNNYDQNGIIRNLIDRLVCYKTVRVIAVSQEVKESFQGHYSARESVIILNGIDVKALQRKADCEGIGRTELDLLPEHFVIGTVGRFHPVKRYSLLLRAFAQFHKRVPHARLLLVGAGQEEIRLRALADQLRIVHAVRWVIAEPAYRYYRLFDLFVLTSEKEGISIALLEAMALGRCCVVTYHVADHPVLKNNHNGGVAQVQKATDLSAFLYDQYHNKKLRGAMGKAAQRKVQEHFSINRMIAAYEGVFKSHVRTICMERR